VPNVYQTPLTVVDPAVPKVDPPKTFAHVPEIAPREFDLRVFCQPS
jgi:hypothetical protein